MAKVLSGAAFLLAAAVAVYMSLVAYGFTAEYGADPNHGGFTEAAAGTATVALFTAVIVAALVGLGTLRFPRRLRIRVLLGATLLAMAGPTIGVLLGVQQ